MSGTPPVVLAVAGTDSGGAAGITADVATIGHLGAHAACVVSAVTAQDTTGVSAVHPVPPDIVAAQVEAVLGDLPVTAVKTGMLGSGEVVALVAERLGHLPLVVDPVLVATSGAVLGDEEVVGAYLEHLLPAAAVVTPNLDEARTLAGHDAPPEELAEELAALGCAVVVTGGDEGGTDWVAVPGGSAVPLAHEHVDTASDHGTGCTFSSALAAALAHRPGGGQLPDADELTAAVRRAAAYTTHQLRAGSGWRLGRGRGPIPHIPPATETEEMA